MEGICPICNQKALQKCSKCHQVFYCGKEHQKEHWKVHKKSCSSVKVKTDDVLGRYLVATRDFKEGDIVLKEKTLILGPAQVTVPVCVGCSKVLQETTAVPCGSCGWPACSEACLKAPHHGPECTLTAARGHKVHIQNFGVPHPNYQALTVVRCLYQKKANPSVWQKLSALQSHCEQRRQRNDVGWQNDITEVAKFTRRFFQLENDFTEEEIVKVCGIVQVNAHEVPLSEPPFVAIYDTTSMIEHNCRANCSKSFTSRGEVLIAAAMPIAANQHVSICYTDPLWGTANRRHHLAETKFFNCACERCKDVTELGTMFSAIRCQKGGCTGYMLPKTFLFETDDKTKGSEAKTNSEKESNGEGKAVSRDWFCNSCDGSVTEHHVIQLMEHVGRDLNAMEKGNCDSCLKFLSHYGKFLHPSHFYMMDVTLALAQLIGQDNQGGLPAVPEERLALKIDLCRQVAEFLEKLVPSEVRGRGGVLFELHAAIAETGRRRAAQEGPGILVDFLQESKKILEKSSKLLQHEPPELPEGKIAIQSKKNLVDMDTLLHKLFQAADLPMM